ncbi:MAG: flagellar assembly protein FliH [Plesiomonas sp.]|uniref:flagellar assembly protein FliH n=1 Tax=Plesiomonas sp. TaxID=2486279 RepID=UPI003F308CED
MDKPPIARYLRADPRTADQFSAWPLPDYSQETVDEQTLNALGYNRTVRWETPDSEEEELSVPGLTAEALAEIQQAAHEEGLAAGKLAGEALGYQAGFEQGQKEGFEKGQQQGYQQGVDDGQIYIREQVDALIQTLAALHQPLRDIEQQLELQLVDMLVTLTKEVTHCEVMLNPAVLLDTIRQAIAALPVAAAQPLILLHPADLQWVESLYGLDAIAERGWRLRTDPTLQRGDVQVSEHISQVTFCMRDRLAAVINQFHHTNHSHVEPVAQAVQHRLETLPTPLSEPSAPDCESTSISMSASEVMNRSTPLATSTETSTTHTSMAHTSPISDQNISAQHPTDEPLCA